MCTPISMPLCFGDMLLWGVDELLTYHYLVAEVFRWVDMPYQDFGTVQKEQADLIWKTLFIDNSPYSEARRGVLTVLNKLGLIRVNDLKHIVSILPGNHEGIRGSVFEISGKSGMTNILDDNGRAVWFESYG